MTQEEITHKERCKQFVLDYSLSTICKRLSKEKKCLIIEQNAQLLDEADLLILGTVLGQKITHGDLMDFVKQIREGDE